MEDLQAAIRQHFNLIPLELKPHGPVWRLQAASGIFLLKKMGCSPGQLIWLADCIHRLITAGFNGVTPFEYTRTGLPYFIFKNQNYIITPWCSGDHPSFTHPAHLSQTAASLGRLHRTSQRALPATKEISINPWNDFQTKHVFLERLMVNLKETATLNRIDRTILRWGCHFVPQARFCLEELARLHQASSSFEKGFCHKDPAPRNIIIQNTGWVLIDYELSTVDFFATDLATLLHRTLSLNHWDVNLVNLIIDAYGAARKLTDEEYRLILISLGFPRKFWRLCSQRFEEKLGWTEKHYQSKFWNLYNEEPHRMAFLIHFFPEFPHKEANHD